MDTSQKTLQAKTLANNQGTLISTGSDCFSSAAFSFLKSPITGL
jgi:hypothetical protein